MADAYFPQGLDSGQSRVPGRQRDLLVAPMAPPSFANSGAGDGGCGRSQPTIFFDGRGAPGVETRHVDILVSVITRFFMFQMNIFAIQMHCQRYYMTSRKELLSYLPVMISRRIIAWSAVGGRSAPPPPIHPPPPHPCLTGKARPTTSRKRATKGQLIHL